MPAGGVIGYRLNGFLSPWRPCDWQLFIVAGQCYLTACQCPPRTATLCLIFGHLLVCPPPYETAPLGSASAIQIIVKVEGGWGGCIECGVWRLAQSSKWLLFSFMPTPLLTSWPSPSDTNEACCCHGSLSLFLSHSLSYTQRMVVEGEMAFKSDLHTYIHIKSLFLSSSFSLFLSLSHTHTHCTDTVICSQTNDGPAVNGRLEMMHRCLLSLDLWGSTVAVAEEEEI